MFTGIINHIGTASIQDSELTVTCENLPSIVIGDSVAINGVCLTVTEVGLNYLKFFIMEETFKRTNFGQLTYVNIEFSLKVGDRYHGHLVQGHIHDLGLITVIDDLEIWIKPRTCHPSIQMKNAITVNGVNLTIAEVTEEEFKVCLIPHTVKSTTFNTLKVQDLVHLEYLISNELHDDNYYMKLALRESEKGRYLAPPNPWVGALLVLNDQIIRTGYHRGSGSHHAEVEVLRDCDQNLEKGVLYITLEPCVAFEGKRTGSCAELIVKSRIRKVVIGCLDEDPRVHSKGVAYLKEHGIEVTLLQDPGVLRSLRPYFHFKRTGTPYVVAKIALSLDGCYAYMDQSTRNNPWITSAPARDHSHHLRASSQAILVGSHTIVEDNPSLTVRSVKGDYRQPLRVCLGPPNTNLVNSEAPLLVIDEIRHPHGEILKKTASGYFDMKEVFELLGQRGIMQCLVEGGSLLHCNLFKNNLIHELHIYRSNTIVGIHGKRWCADLWSDYASFELETVEQLENELYTVYQIKPLIKTSYLEKALRDLKVGKPVILMDDDERENEGDLVMGAQFVTPEMVTFFKKYTTGILCVPMEPNRASRLKLPLLRQVMNSKDNLDLHNTPFTISCDAKVCKTGVSSEERALTIQKLVAFDTEPSELSRPGHVFPLIGAWGGLFERQGHTEGSLELCRLANLDPIAMIGELTNEDGTMMRLQDCKRFAETHNLSLVLMDELIQYCNKMSTPLRILRALSSCEIELQDTGTWTLICYDSGNNFCPHRVLVKGNIYNGAPIATRIHSECFTGDTLGSLHCDCGSQLKLALDTIAKQGAGLIIFPAFHEGRGIGLVSKIRAYRLMSQTNLNTYQANVHLGYQPDERTYEAVLSILKDLKVTKIDLLTNNPQKITALQPLIHNIIPLIVPPNDHNRDYLQTKHNYESTQLQQKISTVNHNMKASPMISSITSLIAIAIVSTYWNEDILEPHCLDIQRYLKEAVPQITIHKILVPGSFEIPYGVRSILNGNFDAIICLGTIIKGDTAHFKYISSSVIDGLMKLQVLGSVPIINGILNTYTRDQALERLASNSGQAESLALSALRMITTFTTH